MKCGKLQARFQHAKTYCERTTAHGFGYVVRADNVIER